MQTQAGGGDRTAGILYVLQRGLHNVACFRLAPREHERATGISSHQRAERSPLQTELRQGHSHVRGFSRRGGVFRTEECLPLKTPRGRRQRLEQLLLESLKFLLGGGLVGPGVRVFQLRGRCTHLPEDAIDPAEKTGGGLHRRGHVLHGAERGLHALILGVKAAGHRGGGGTRCIRKAESGRGGKTVKRAAKDFLPGPEGAEGTGGVILGGNGIPGWRRGVG